MPTIMKGGIIAGVSIFVSIYWGACRYHKSLTGLPEPQENDDYGGDLKEVLSLPLDDSSSSSESSVDSTLSVSQSLLDRAESLEKMSEELLDLREALSSRMNKVIASVEEVKASDSEVDGLSDAHDVPDSEFVTSEVLSSLLSSLPPFNSSDYESHLNDIESGEAVFLSAVVKLVDAANLQSMEKVEKRLERLRAELMDMKPPSSSDSTAAVAEVAVSDSSFPDDCMTEDGAREIVARRLQLEKDAEDLDLAKVRMAKFIVVDDIDVSCCVEVPHRRHCYTSITKLLAGIKILTHFNRPLLPTSPPRSTPKSSPSTLPRLTRCRSLLFRLPFMSSLASLPRSALRAMLLLPVLTLAAASRSQRTREPSGCTYRSGSS